MKHICHISTTFNLRSGSARRTSAIIRESVGLGYRVSLVIGRDHDLTESDLPGVEIYPVPRMVKYVKPGYDCRAPWDIKKILAKIKPDLVHTHLAKGGILGRLAAKRAGIPYILHTVHGPTFPSRIGLHKRIIYRTMERFCGRMTDQFVFVGKELQQTYLQARVCSRANSHVIQTGRPDNVVDRQPLSDSKRKRLRNEVFGGFGEDFLIVTVGRLVPAKQLEHAVSITAKLRQKGVPARLAIVGKSLLVEEQGYEYRLLQLARDLQVDEFVVFTGFRTDVPDIMDAADVVLLTSRYEGLPNVAVEALIAKKPMVAYNVSGISEVLKHKKTGYIVQQGDMDHAVAGLLFCRSGGMKLSEQDERQRNATLDSFRESTMVRKKMNLYKQIFSSLNCGE